ncbi:MAG: hypothetical protein Q8Q97_02405 [bacterium]|nr:hypothetical protein [bacterium]
MPTRVAIVNEGEWGAVKREEGDYDEFAGTLEKCLTEATWSDGNKKAEVKVVKNSEEALSWLQNAGAMIFVTRGMLWKAKEIAQKHRHIRVVLFTGLIPEGEVIFAEKAYLNREQIKAIVLG